MNLVVRNGPRDQILIAVANLFTSPTFGPFRIAYARAPPMIGEPQQPRATTREAPPT